MLFRLNKFKEAIEEYVDKDIKILRNLESLNFHKIPPEPVAVDEEIISELMNEPEQRKAASSANGYFELI